MAEINPPFVLHNAGATHTAENDRTSIGALIAGASASGSLISRGGVAPALGGALAVTPNTALTLNIASGVIFVPGSESTKQGVYICTNDATDTITLDTAHGTLPRIDRIIARVYDAVYSGTTNTWILEKVTGTAAASPVAPTLPANSMGLALVSVAAAATTINSGNITDDRTFMGQGVISSKSSNKPALNTVADGQLLVLTDTGEIQAKISGAYQTKSYQSTLVNRQVFNASGTWTKPAGAKSVYVQVQGGGGAGGGAAITSASQASVGSGGGAGGYADGILDAAILAATVTVTIGAGGGATVGSAGGNGSGSSFGAHITASGGTGGDVRAASTIGFGVEGGSGGSTFTGGQLQIPGGDGGAGWGDGQLSISGPGGSSFLSGSAKSVKTQTAGQKVTGPAGKPNGGGGAGAANSSSVTATAGGNGGQGVVIVTTYF